MPWYVARLKNLDNAHLAAAAWAWRKGCLGIGGRVACRRLRWRNTEQVASFGKIGGPHAAGQEAIMPYTVQALGQHMHQEAADEFVRGQRHSRVATRPLDPVILHLEGDGAGIG